MKQADRFIVTALAAGIWMLGAVLVSRPDPVQAQLSARAIQAIVEQCSVEGFVTGSINGRVEGSVTGDVQIQQGKFGTLQNGRIAFATVSGKIAQGRLVNGRIICPAP